MTSRLEKARQVYRERGFRAMLAAIARSLANRAIRYWNRDHVWEGKIVEWMGNRLQIDGVRIVVDNPVISTSSKGAMWKGTYEKHERQLFKQFFPSNTPVIELGGGAGVVSCITNRRLQNPSQHIVLEANPEMIPTLEQNRALNGCQFQIIHGALGYLAKEMDFYLQDKFVAGSLEKKSERSIKVPAYTLQAIAEAGKFQRCNVICDIEGMEVALGQHEMNFLKAHVEWFLVELHPKIMGKPKISEFQDLLQKNSFELRGSSHTVRCYQNVGLSAAPRTSEKQAENARVSAE